jgi:uncharacterized lipoprotein YmbA
MNNPCKGAATRRTGRTGNRLWIAAGLLALLLGGCLSRPSLHQQWFAFAPPPNSGHPPPPQAPILSVRQVTVAAPFDGQSFVYRTGQFSYERDPYAGFLAPAPESLASAIREGLRQSGDFREVLQPGSALRPSLVMEIAVSGLFGDFRQHGAGWAVLDLRVVCFRAGGPADRAERQIVLDKDYRRRLPLRARTAAGLMAGWNEALRQILAEVAKDLAAQA